MPRAASCRRCGKPGPSSFCDTCRGETYGSQEYRSNSAYIRDWDRGILKRGGLVHCVICEQRITDPDDITVEHIRSVSEGGTNSLANLGSAHARCNYSKRAAH